MSQFRRDWTSFSTTSCKYQNYLATPLCSLWQHHCNRSLDLFSKIPTHFIIVGDFNANNSTWGSTRTCQKGKLLEQQFIDNLAILNTGEISHIYTYTHTHTHLVFFMQHNPPQNLLLAKLPHIAPPIAGRYEMCTCINHMILNLEILVFRSAGRC